MDTEREIKVFNIGQYFPNRVVKIALVVVLIVLVIRVWDALVYVWN